MCAVHIVRPLAEGGPGEGIWMTTIGKAVALTALLALGLAAGAGAASAWRWPITTTTATTATSTSTSTTVPTTTDIPSSVRIIAPLNGTPYTRGSTELVVGDVRSESPVASCTIDFGDLQSTVVTATQVAPDDYRCSAAHLYLTLRGRLTVRVVATATDTVVGQDAIQVLVV
jgi:hypothetical protein